MKNPAFNRPAVFAGLFILAVLLLAACQAPSPQATTASPNAPEELPAGTAAATASPSPSPEPSPTPAPERVLLWAPEESDPGQVEALQAVLEELAGKAGYVVDSVSTFSADGLSPELRLVVALPPAEGLQDLASAAPQTQFLAVGIPEAEPAANLSRVLVSQENEAARAFLAGYSSVLITPDWRVGMVVGPDSSQALREGFQNGITFYCGLCRPAYPPFVAYPQFVELTPGASQAEIDSAVAALSQASVQTVFLDPAVEQTALEAALAAAGIQIIASGTPPAEAQAAWVFSIQGAGGLDGALRELWPALTSGQGGADLQLSLGLAEINPDRLSPGRQRLVEETLAELNAGLIQPAAPGE